MKTLKLMMSGMRVRSMCVLFIYCLVITLFCSLLLFLSPNYDGDDKSSPTNRRLNDINDKKLFRPLSKNETEFLPEGKATIKNHKTLSNAERSKEGQKFSSRLQVEKQADDKHVSRGNKNSPPSKFAGDTSENVATLPSSEPNNNNNNKNNNNNNKNNNDNSTTTHKTTRQQQRHPTMPPKPLVPRTAHVVWFYPNATLFRFHQALSLLSVQKFFRPSKIFFWHDSLPSGTWWMFARQSVAHLLLVPLERPRRIFNWSVSVPEHQSDVSRIRLLTKYGGLYVDLDVILLKNLDPLLRYEVTMGAETPDILGSGFIMARPNAAFLRLWLDGYRKDFDDADWNRHSTKVPMELARSHPELVHVEWFAINRPNWFERNWLYEEGRLWDWSGNYAVHLWYREHDVEYSPLSIRRLNTTVAEIFRFIYYQSPKLLLD